MRVLLKPTWPKMLEFIGERELFYTSVPLIHPIYIKSHEIYVDERLFFNVDLT